MNIVMWLVGILGFFGIGAIVDSPLLGMGAKKSIGKTITYFRLKGQNIARQRVIPANPNTAAQQTQRGLMSTVVGYFHTLGLNALDLAALNRWASAAFRKLSGYNLFVRTVLDYILLGGTENYFAHGVSIGSVTASGAVLSYTAKSAGTGKVMYGTSKTSQLSEKTSVDATGDSWSGTLTGLAASTTYYAYIEQADAASKAIRGGLYTFTTTA